MKKLTNVQKILKALKSGPKTQADLVRETKVKNVYQIIADLKKRKLSVYGHRQVCVHLMQVPYRSR
jgi:hypothetical protein